MLANSHGSSQAISTVKFRQEEMKKVVIIVMADNIIHCRRLKTPTTFWRLDLPLFSGGMEKWKNLHWWA